MLKTNWVKLIFTILTGFIIWIIPAPSDVQIQAWHLFAIFVATIVGIILRPLPMGAIAMVGIVMTALTGTLSITEALSGFGNRVIWLIVSAFMLSRGFIKTGLGARIAYLFMSIFGKNSLGLAYGFVATDLVLAPAIPSNTGRSGGVIFPILRSTARAYDSEPEQRTSRKIGAFLMKTSFQAQIITCAMFMTAMAANPLCVELAQELGVPITWAGWALAASIPGLLSLLIVPLLIYKLYPPEIKHTSEATQLARQKLADMGRMKTNEWILLGTFILLLLLWIFGRLLNLHGTTAALAGLGILLISGVLT